MKDNLVYNENLKKAFDQIFNKAMKKHSITWQQIRDAVNEAFEIIFKNFLNMLMIMAQLIMIVMIR